VTLLSIPTPTHGRVLVEDAADSSSPRRGLIVAFHGYGQSAEDMLADVRRIPGASAWTLASVQGLHRFYARDNQRVIASWMTRQDRELAIADNVEYVNRVVERVGGRSVEHSGATAADPPGVFHGSTSDPLVFLGFSQGVAMAYRAALLGAHAPAGVIALAGDIPPELKAQDAAVRPWPPVLVATGARDTWFTPARLADDVAFLESRGIPHESVVFDGGHEWGDAFREAAGRWLSSHSQHA
jgi:predicted esterase